MTTAESIGKAESAKNNQAAEGGKPAAMARRFKRPALLTMLLAAAPAALAALTINSTALNGSTSIAVTPGGATIAATVTATTDATNTWMSTGWAIGSGAPATYTCVDTPDYASGGLSASENFNITAPSTAGTYNAYFLVASNGTCGGQTTLANMPASIIVAAPTLTKTASSASGIVGDVITFKLRAANPLSLPLNNVTVTDTLPAGMAYSTSAATLGSVDVSDQIVTWTIPAIPASSYAELTLAVQLKQQGTLTNTATSPGAASASTSIVVLPQAITHFRLDEPAGSWKGTPGEVIDSGGTGLTGKRFATSTPTTTNAVSPSPTIASQNPAVVGSFCNAGSFDGKGYVVVASNTLLQYTTTLSATAWIYPTAKPSSDLYSILSNDVNYEFHLDTNQKLYWWWNSSSLTSKQSIPLNQWTHVAITMDSSSTGGRERIYINGVLDANTKNWKGTLATNSCDFYIGGDILTDGKCSPASARNFHGMIDEVKLYNYELSAAEVQADMTLGRNCSGAFDHIEIDHDSNASVCTPETVTVKACLDSACSTLYPGSVTVNLSPDGWVGGNAFTFTGGVATRQLSGSAGTVTLGTTSVSPTPSNATRCFVGTTETCSLTFNSASCAFDAVEPSANPRTHIYTKLADTAFNLDVLALTPTSVIDKNYQGTANVDLVDASTSTCPTGSGLFSPPTSVSFGSADKGRKTVTFNYPDAAKNVRVRIIKTGSSTPACSSDNFAIRPQRFAISSDMTNTVLTGAPKATAGTAFTLTAAAGVSAGYDGTPAIDTTKVNDHNGTAIASGTLLGSFAAGTGTSASGNSFKYLDVGNIQFATDAVVDSGFSSVDQSGDCVAGSTSTTLSGSKYGCNVGSAATGKFGRWYPDHYSFSGTLTPGCSSGGFTYMDNDALAVALAVKAHATTGAPASASDPVLSRYTTGYPNLASVTVAGDNSGTAVSVTRLTNPSFPGMPNSALWSAGVFQISDTYAFSKLAAPDGPYDQFRLLATLSDPDGSALLNSPGQTNTTRLRYGRLRIGNAYGSELLDLPIPFAAQYWTSGGWLTNRDDSCTSINPSSIMLSNFTRNLSACETHLSPTTAQTLANGKASLKLTKPGAGNQGSVQLTMNVGAAASGSTCLSASATSATAGNLPWFGSNPTGTATFGVFRSPYIYLHEQY